MISSTLRKKIELWSLITALFVMIIIFLLFIFLYVTTSRTEGKSEMQATRYEKYEEFGIITQEDIYIDNMEKGRRYTSHGRLILNKSEQ